jgi:hypothetical protein
MRFGLAVVLIALVVAIAMDDFEADEAGVAAGLVVLAAIVAIMRPSDWRGLIARLKKAKVGPVDLELGVEEAKEAARGALISEVEEPDTSEPDQEPALELELIDESAPKSDEDEEVTNLLALRLKLEAKLTYIAKWLLGDEADGRASFVTVGSLHYDGYLTDEEAHTATRVLMIRDEELEAVAAAEAREFRTAADKVVSNIRASVFFGMVRKRLRAEGWEVDLLEESAKRRPDLLATKAEIKCRVAPRFAMRTDSAQLEKTLNRLANTAAGEADVQRRVVVIPDRSRAELTDASSDPRVMKLEQLSELESSVEAVAADRAG